MHVRNWRQAVIIGQTVLEPTENMSNLFIIADSATATLTIKFHPVGHTAATYVDIDSNSGTGAISIKEVLVFDAVEITSDEVTTCTVQMW